MGHAGANLRRTRASPGGLQVKEHVRARARARESFVFDAGDKGDVPVCRAPLAGKLFFDESVYCHFRRAASKQPSYGSPPFVNLPLIGFVVGVPLAGADDGWFSGHGKIIRATVASHCRARIKQVNGFMVCFSSSNALRIYSECNQRFSQSRPAWRVYPESSLRPCR